MLVSLAVLTAAACQPAPGAPPAPPPTTVLPTTVAKPAPVPTAQGTESAQRTATAAPPAVANPYLARPGEALTPMKVVWCAISGGFMHLYAARDAKLFGKYGLDAQASLVRGSDVALAALQAGEADFVFCAAEATIPGMAAGADGVLIGAPLVGLPYVLVGPPELTSLQDLKGKSVGINRPGDLDDRLTRAILSYAGIPATDVTLRPSGQQTERYQALVMKAVDAITVTPPLEVQARKDGFHVVFELKALPIPFIYSALHTNRKTLRERPELVQRFMAAMAESIYYAEANKAETERALANELKLEDAEALESAYKAYAQDYVNRGMDISLTAVQDSIEYARQQGTKIQYGKAEEFVDNSFVNQLRESGFLAALWGRPIPAPAEPTRAPGR